MERKELCGTPGDRCFVRSRPKLSMSDRTHGGSFTGQLEAGNLNAINEICEASDSTKRTHRAAVRDVIGLPGAMTLVWCLAGRQGFPRYSSQATRLAAPSRRTPHPGRPPLRRLSDTGHRGTSAPCDAGTAPRPAAVPPSVHPAAHPPMRRARASNLSSNSTCMAFMGGCIILGNGGEEVEV